jgi:hypothetical protein
MVVGRLIFGVDRERQRFDGREMKLAHLLHAPVFLLEPVRRAHGLPVVRYPKVATSTTLAISQNVSWDTAGT